jgi:ADP-heptose:LPS heptosyltransferase
LKRNPIGPTEQPAILVHVTGDRIGDALIKWPIIVALKNALAEYRLVWLAGLRTSVFKGPLAPLAAGVIDEVWDLAGVGVSWSEFLRSPLPGRFDIVIATEPKIRSALLLRRIRHEVFISPALNFRLSDRRPAPARPYPDSVFEQMRCLATLAAGRELEVDTALRVGDENAKLARELLPGERCYVGFAPGSAGRHKRWPVARFIELAQVQARLGRTPVFFLGPQEASMYRDIAAAVPSALFPEQSAPAAGRGGPLLGIALAQRIRLGVANDAGGGHLLAAGGRPLITLFGRTSERKFKPPYGRRIAITAGEYGGTDMALIPIVRVVQAIDDILQGDRQ